MKATVVLGVTMWGSHINLPTSGSNLLHSQRKNKCLNLASFLSFLQPRPPLGFISLVGSAFRGALFPSVRQPGRGCSPPSSTEV